MALRGKKPELTEDRLKLILFSDAGVGKTTACCSMPYVYYIDNEKGVKNRLKQVIIDNHGAYMGVDDGALEPNEILKEVEELARTRHSYRTLVIDSQTTLFEARADEGMRTKGYGIDFNKHIVYADVWAKRLMRALTMLDMNIILTSHEKDVWREGKNEGKTADGYRKQRYTVDLCLRLERAPNGKRFALVDKTRYPDEFPDQDKFEWSYAELERRWGQARMMKEATPIALASPEQVATLTRMIEALNIPSETTDKWLKAAEADTWADLTSDLITKAIAYCQVQIDKAAAKE